MNINKLKIGALYYYTLLADEDFFVVKLTKIKNGMYYFAFYRNGICVGNNHLGIEEVTKWVYLTKLEGYMYILGVKGYCNE